MREIKFRAWDVNKKQWVADGVPMDLNYSGKANCFMFDNDAFDIPKNVIWLQFTGLKDKNGKEIWEGDVIKDLKGLSPSMEAVAFVVFRDGAFVDSYWHHEVSSHEFCEVLGNIYENPELIR